MRRVVVAAALLLTACSALLAQHHPASSARTAPSTAPRCANVVAEALASPEAPVAGVMDCLSQQSRSLAADSGIYDDSDFQHLVAGQDPMYNSATYCGRAADGNYVYALASSDGLSTARMGLTMQNGLVDAFNGSTGSGCPQGLR